MKNTVYAIVIGACILVAVVVFVKTRSGGKSAGVNAISDTQMTWMKCKACNNTFEMSEKEYYKTIQEKATSNPAAMMFTPPMQCPKCQKLMAFKAEKCANCGEVFILGTVPNDFQDRCPKCKHSKIEDSRKARTGQ